MVNKARVEPKTVQGILRHAKIQTTLDLYTQEDGDETLAAQGEYLTALGLGAVKSEKCGLDCGLSGSTSLRQNPVTLKGMVGLGGLEPPTSPLSVVIKSPTTDYDGL
jgi:hypothetical protein